MTTRNRKLARSEFELLFKGALIVNRIKKVYELDSTGTLISMAFPKVFVSQEPLEILVIKTNARIFNA
jgi:hypothetical protein